MQPTYVPWLGYFALMDSVDIFIFLDSVAFDHRSWQHRNQIKTPNGPLWLTVPTRVKGLRGQLIRDTQIDRERSFPSDHVRSIDLNYAKAPYYDRYASSIFDFLQRGSDLLIDVTVPTIRWIAGELGIATQCISSSSLAGEGSKADLLASFCANLNVSEYISPPGSRAYLEESDVFARHNIDVSYFEYEHPVYRQRFGDFISHMSIVDLLMNEGPASGGIVRQGLKRGEAVF
jgi:hypothetical protein